MNKTSNWMEHTLSQIAVMSDVDIFDMCVGINSKQQLKRKLSDIVSHLLDHDFEKLLFILYRIDVDEEKAKALLSRHTPDQAPDILADLIIQRQQKKDEVKKQFESGAKHAEADEDLLL